MESTFSASDHDRFIHFPAVPDDQEGGLESVEEENTLFQAPTFTNHLVHDHPKHGLAPDQVEEERNLFLEIPVVKLDSETVGEEHEIFDPLLYEESVDDLRKMESDWPFKGHSVNDINYEDPYDLAEVKTVGETS